MATKISETLAQQARRLSQDSPPTDLIEWGRHLARCQGVPAQMAALFDRLGPQETARLLRLATFAADRSHSFPLEMAETLTTFTTALATGSAGLADPRGFADELARWLLPPELSDDEQEDLLAHGGLPLCGPAALAQLVRGPSFAPDFLAGLADRVAHFEGTGKVDPADYYQHMTPSRYDDYLPHDIADLLFGQISEGAQDQAG